MNFREYLISKKIDPDKFKSGEAETYRKFNIEFSQMHPNSFTAQKMFVINKLRRKFLLEKEPEEKAAAKPKAARPKIAPRINKQ